ncbi:MAG: hypothetical protein KAJ88_03645 [Candidatus Aenigmarchaeota archaeon]|nr:hypothetical protein [Candidatus Aenigmarchaeota archaeon]
MEIALFMVLIAASSVFVMLSLGYSNKKDDGGYISELFRKVLDGGKKTQGHEYEGSSIIEGMGGIEAAQAMIDTETARVEQILAEQDANIDGINEILSKHVYGNDTPPSDEETLAKLNRADDSQKYDKTGEERKEIPDNLDDIMAAWEKGENGPAPTYGNHHRRGHPHGA